MRKLEELIREIGEKRSEDNPFPEDFDAFLQDFVPNKLLRSETLKIAFDVSDQQMEELYTEAFADYEDDEFEHSVRTFQFLVLLDPYVPRYWMGLAASKQLLGEYEAALHAYAMVTFIDKDNPAPHLYAHECYKELGQEEDAALALKQAEELQPC